MGPVIRIKYQGRRVLLIGTGPRKYQLFQLAQVGVRSIKARVAQGIGSDDTPMPPLKSRRRMRWSKSRQQWVEYGVADSSRFGYAARKRRAGLRPMRDLTGPGTDGGHMLDALRVTSASETRATIDISTRSGRLKARANEQRAPWFGFSGRDVRTMMETARKIWGQNVAAFQAQFRGVGTRANNEVPVWMDPLGISGRAGLVSNFRPTLAGRMADKLAGKYGRQYGRQYGGRRRAA
jgi:hypothetical protein